jgi:predicted nucleic acid-binding Zn ribbon protein
MRELKRLEKQRQRSQAITTAILASIIVLLGLIVVVVIATWR